MVHAHDPAGEEQHRLVGNGRARAFDCEPANDDQVDDHGLHVLQSGHEVGDELVHEASCARDAVVRAWARAVGGRDAAAHRVGHCPSARLPQYTT